MTKKTFSILAILIVGLALGGCAYNPFLKQQPSDQGQTPQQGNGEEPSIKEESKLYSHPSGEYFFRYPSDWEAVDVNEQGENYVVETRITTQLEPLLIELGEFSDEFDIRFDLYNNMSIAQRFYSFNNLVSIIESKKGEMHYVVLEFLEESKYKAVVGMREDSKGFFINIKEGWNGSQQAEIERFIGSFSFFKDISAQSVESYCKQKDKIFELEIIPDVFTDKSTQLAIKVLDGVTKQPVVGVTIGGDGKYGFHAKTDSQGEYVETMYLVPDKPRFMESGSPLYPSLSVIVVSNKTIYSAGVNLKSNARMKLTYYLPPSIYSGGKFPAEYSMGGNESIDVKTYTSYKCPLTLYP